MREEPRRLKLGHVNLAASARAHAASLRWRLGQTVAFAFGVGLVLQSAAAGLGWLVAVAGAMLLDHALAESFLAARITSNRRRAAAMLVGGRAFTGAVVAALSLGVAWSGGDNGRMLAQFALGGALISILLTHRQSWMLLIAGMAPYLAALVALMFISDEAYTAAFWWGAAGVACALATFAAHLLRAAHLNSELAENLRTATREARERQVEAEAKRADAEAANRAKSEFLTTMTHELRTPLNAVIGYAEIIAEDNAEAAPDAGRIEKSARHLLGLIDQILQLSVMETGRAELAISEFNIRHMIEDVVAAHSEAARQNGNRISVRVGADVAVARTDRAKLETCLGHLLSNAAKFTQDGLVAVSAALERQDGVDWLRLAVSDTGAGMSAEGAAKAFLPFTQIDNTMTRAQGGLGLGLAFTQRTVQILGGVVSVESEEGKGSTFTLRLPARLGEIAASDGEKLLTRLGAAA